MLAYVLALPWVTKRHCEISYVVGKVVTSSRHQLFAHHKIPKEVLQYFSLGIVSINV